MPNLTVPCLWEILGIDVYMNHSIFQQDSSTTHTLQKCHEWGDE